MIFDSSWNERRLRKQIIGQSKKRRSRHIFKRILLIVAILFGAYVLYAQFMMKEDDKSVESPQISVTSQK